MSTRPSAEGAGSENAALAALIAHELNNIAVPLQGFLDLAGAEPTANASVQRCLDEVRIGVMRIAALARQLERLVPAPPALAPASAGECVVDPVDPANRLPAVRFDCNPATLILTDVSACRQALRSLLDLADRDATLEVTSGTNAGAMCAGCGAKLGPPQARLHFTIRGLRLPGPGAIKEPWNLAHGVRAVRRLALAACVSCAHRANGHIVAGNSGESISLVFPLS